MEHFAVAVADFGLSIYTSGSLTVNESAPGADPVDAAPAPAPQIPAPETPKA